MSADNEVLEDVIITHKNPLVFSIITTLGYVGNIIWAFLFGVLLTGCIINGKAMLESVNINDFFGGIVVFFAVLSLFFICACVVCMIGLSRMKKGWKSGLYLYLISNGVWVLSLVYASDGDWAYISMAMVSLFFMVFFFLNRKKFH